jgi:excisionase family DNA binding protein
MAIHAAIPVTSLDEQIRRMTPVSAPAAARAELAELAKMLGPTPSGPARLVGPHGVEVALPEPVYHLLERIVELLARGLAVTLVPVGKLLTTQQAAGVLNVSRQYLVRLLDANEIPHGKVGKHRRLKIEDVLAYKMRRDADRQSKLAELTRLTEEAGGYDEP